jgi:hypothetical protein
VKRHADDNFPDPFIPHDLRDLILSVLPCIHGFEGAGDELKLIAYRQSDPDCAVVDSEDP